MKGYDVLPFIDSPDIREFNKHTKFLPAEQAVLIAVSKTKTVEEKLEVLQYLADQYSDNEFGTEKVYEYWCTDKRESFRDTVMETIRIWRDILQDRYDSEGYVYAMTLGEKGFVQRDFYEYCFFSSYDKAYESMVSGKQQYLDDEDLRDTQTYGEILRIRIDEPKFNYSDCDEYHFDNELRLIEVAGQHRVEKGDEYYGLISDYSIYVPLPFAPGDIVKYDSLLCETQYGVFSHEWEPPINRMFTSLEVSVDVYDERQKTFDYTDDTWILSLTYCTDDELPKGQDALRLIREVRKGKMDFYHILHWYSRDNLNGLIQMVKKAEC
jgi:uncharacterized protein YutE (UPF0331/DUF86 family)